MHRVVLVLILLPTTLPAAAQTTVGVRAGLGSAKLAEHSEYYETTRLAAIQVGFVFPGG